MDGRDAMVASATPDGLDRHCGARTKRRTGAPCERPAGWGTSHPGVGRCKLHGGSTPHQVAGAVVVLEDRRARSILARLEQPEPIDHPVLELLKLAAEASEFQRILRERLNELHSLETTDTLGTERERAVVVLYERALDRNARLLTDMAKLGLQERALRVNEETAGRVMQALVEALRRAGLGQHEIAVRQHLKDVLAEMGR